tara:strand:+ start:430 stop:981 length:552 start_codon:yes stop_codon:yes gene_type:complete
LKKYIYTYQTKNLLNGKTYIGVHSTNKANDSYLGSGILLAKAIEKYGKSVFKKEILDFFNTKEEAYLEEAFLVTEETVKDNSNYNLGIGGGNKSKLTDSHKQAFCHGNKGRVNNRKGMALSDSHYNNIRDAKARVIGQIKDGKHINTFMSYDLEKNNYNYKGVIRAIKKERPHYKGFQWFYIK